MTGPNAAPWRGMPSPLRPSSRSFSRPAGSSPRPWRGWWVSAVADVDPAAIRARHALWFNQRLAVSELVRNEADDATIAAAENINTRLADQVLVKLPALLALVDDLTAQLATATRTAAANKAAYVDTVRDSIELEREIAAERDELHGRLAEVENATEEFRVECRVKGGRWVEWITTRPTLDQALAVCGPDPDPRRFRVRQVRHSDRVVWPPEEPSHEKAPESPQDAAAHPETRETGGSPAL